MGSTAVIADDEPLLRAMLRSRLAKLWPELEVVHEMENGRGVEAVIDEHDPDLFFLDIHMPGVNGLEAARAIAGRAHVVFVTAYDQYAVEAFERGAIDYVLKPFNEERLGVTVERLRERLEMKPASVDALVEQLAGRLGARPAEHLRWIKASVGSNVRLIPVEEVLFFQSDEKYTRVALADGEALIKTPIRELIDGLDPEVFWQIHRSTLVNVNAIAGVTRDFRGQAHVKIKGKDENLVVSRIYSHLFKQM